MNFMSLTSIRVCIECFQRLFRRSHGLAAVPFGVRETVGSLVSRSQTTGWPEDLLLELPTTLAFCMYRRQLSN
jgi:hypothetical protein